MMIIRSHSDSVPRFTPVRAVPGLVLAIVSAGLASSPALAQEAPDFSGPRVEGILGWDNSGVNFDDDLFEEGRTSQDGFFYGLGVGYDFQFDGFVAGIEGEWSNSTAGKVELINGLSAGGAVISADADIDVGNDFYVGVRGGGLVTPNLLLYAKAGYTHSSIEAEGLGIENGVPFSFDGGIDIDGFRLGAGGEYAFASNWFGKLEYRYSNYNNGELDIEGEDVDLDSTFDAIDVDRHQVVLGFGYRF